MRKRECEKWAKRVGDDSYMFSPDFVPDENAPQGAIGRCKRMLSCVVGFDDHDFEWPTGVAMMF